MHLSLEGGWHAKSMQDQVSVHSITQQMKTIYGMFQRAQAMATAYDQELIISTHTP